MIAYLPQSLDTGSMQGQALAWELISPSPNSNAVEGLDPWQL